MVLKTREDIGQLLENEKFESAIEVGVHNGAYADTLISQWNSCKKYIMIDPWLHQKFYDDGANSNNLEQKKIFINSMNIVNKWFDRVEFIILRTTSKAAINYLKNQQYDFIFLDGRHDYVSVKQDIEMYYPILKPGGIFAGHDYQDENGGEWRMDEKGNVIKEKKAVKAAVDEFARKNNLHIVTTNENNYKTWLIRKPIKIYDIKKK